MFEDTFLCVCVCVYVCVYVYACVCVCVCVCVSGKESKFAYVSAGMSVYVCERKNK